MSAPVVPDLAADTLARKYIFEVDLNNNLLAPDWQPVGGILTFTYVGDNPVMNDSRRFSDKGADRQTKAGTGWSCASTFSRAPKADDTTQYDDGQEFLRAHGEGTIGGAAEVNIRFFEFDEDDTLPRVQAYEGRVSVSYTEPNGGGTDNSIGSVALTGQGTLNVLDHPYPATPSAPVLDSCVPGSSGEGTIATAGGMLVHIRGTGFATVTGASHVTFGGTNAEAYSVESDSLIIAVAPAKTAGTVALVVTNTTGASSGLNVTYA